MGKERTGRIMFGAVEHIVGTGPAKTGLEIERGSGATLRLGVAKSRARQDLGKKELLLFFGAVLTESVEKNEMALRELGDGRIGGCENLKHLRECLGGDISSAMGARHGDSEKTTRRKQIEFGNGFVTFAITRGSLGREQRRNFAGDGQSLAI